MRFKWVVAFSSLMIPAIAGCQTAMPVRPAAARNWQENANNVSAAPQVEPTSVDNVGPVRFGEHESPPDSRASDGREKEALTLGDLEEIAFRHNPTLAVAAARLDAARGRQVQARLYPNPVVGYHATEVGNLGTAGQQGGFVSQRFITGGKLRLDRAIAGKEIDEASSRLNAQAQRVLSDVRTRYYEAFVAQSRAELTRKLVRIGDDLVQATKKLIKGRQATDNDLLQAEIRADEARILHDNAGNESNEAWQRLTAVIGLPTLQAKRLNGSLDADLPRLNWDDCYAMVLGDNPELNAARVRADRAQIVIDRARREPIPNVDVWVSVRHINVTGSDVANVQVGIPLPIFDRNQGNVRAAQAGWVAARNEVKRIELDLQDRLAVAYRRYANARQQVDRYGQRIVPRADKSLALVSNGYDKGQVSYLTLLTAQQTYVKVSLSYLDSLRELWASAAVLEGQLLSGSLTSRP